MECGALEQEFPGQQWCLFSNLHGYLDVHFNSSFLIDKFMCFSMKIVLWVSIFGMVLTIKEI